MDFRIMSVSLRDWRSVNTYHHPLNPNRTELGYECTPENPRNPHYVLRVPNTTPGLTPEYWGNMDPSMIGLDHEIREFSFMKSLPTHFGPIGHHFLPLSPETDSLQGMFHGDR